MRIKKKVDEGVAKELEALAAIGDDQRERLIEIATTTKSLQVVYEAICRVGTTFPDRRRLLLKVLHKVMQKWYNDWAIPHVHLVPVMKMLHEDGLSFRMTDPLDFYSRALEGYETESGEVVYRFLVTVFSGWSSHFTPELVPQLRALPFFEGKRYFWALCSKRKRRPRRRKRKKT